MPYIAINIPIVAGRSVRSGYDVEGVVWIEHVVIGWRGRVIRMIWIKDFHRTRGIELTWHPNCGFDGNCHFTVNLPSLVVWRACLREETKVTVLSRGKPVRLVDDKVFPR